MRMTSSRDQSKKFRTPVILLLAVTWCCTACTPTYTLMDGEELFAFWDMSHPLYHGRPLHVLMPEGYYHFVDSISIEYRGMECFVSGKATRDGSGAWNVVRLPMLESRRVWLDMHLRLFFKNGDEEEYSPGFWYFEMQRGVPLYLTGMRVDPDAEARNALRETQYRYNDMRAMGWRSGFYSPVLNYAATKARQELGLEDEEE